MNKMKRHSLLIAVVFFMSGCMASFPGRYEPEHSANQQYGKEQQIYTTTKFLTMMGTESRDLSLKLQLLVDSKIEEWGFSKDRSGKKIDITVQNVFHGGYLASTLITSILCGLSLYIIPSVATDNYKMTVVISEEGKEPITRIYNGSITTYQQIIFILWGIIAFPPTEAMYKVVDSMLDHLMYDLAMS